MKSLLKATGLAVPAAIAAAGFFCSSAAGQAAPVVNPAEKPVVVSSTKPKTKANGLVKFEGFVTNANIAQITAKQRGNELTIQTFSLSQKASAKMQQVVDKGGYQYGDKVTIYYNPTTMQAMRFKGKPSKPI